MSLSHAMNTLSHTLVTARAARREAIAGVGMTAAQDLKEARQSRRAMAAAHSFRITAFKHNLHVNTAMLLGAAHNQIDEYGRQREQMTMLRPCHRRGEAGHLLRLSGICAALLRCAGIEMGDPPQHHPGTTPGP
ncbi:MAG: hypothetical protein FD149_245 [Rhodospirillaceae bacterium]|nr:MAG: hypothetical protein FD149_245 [Rhodospirillaceae bacterium]